MTSPMLAIHRGAERHVGHRLVREKVELRHRGQYEPAQEGRAAAEGFANPL